MPKPRWHFGVDGMARDEASFEYVYSIKENIVHWLTRKVQNTTSICHKPSDIRRNKILEAKGVYGDLHLRFMGSVRACQAVM